MYRVALIFPLLALPLLVGAPRLKDQEKDIPFLMVKEGDKKVSATRIGDSVITVTEVVTKVSRNDDIIRVTMSWEVNGNKRSESNYEASAKGIFVVAAGGKEYAAPFPHLRLPAKTGKSWTWEQQIRGVAPTKHTRTIGSWEDIKVPAGKFRALRVDAKLECETVPDMVGTSWYAPGVGIVKSEINTNDGVQSTVLIEYKPAK